MDFDAILGDVGEFGHYQKLVIYLILLPAVIPCGFHAYAQLFMAAGVAHWCRVPELEHLADQELVKNLSIPLEDKNGNWQYSQCSMYNLNYSDVLKSTHSIEDAIARGPAADIIPCKNGWSYDKNIYKSTVVTEWNLVCNDDFLPTLGLVLLAAGGLIGNYIFGYLQDTIGRKPSFFIYLLIECVFGVATAFAQNYVVWTIYRIGVGFTVPAIMATPYVLAIELVGPRHRTLCTILSNIAYSLGLILLAGVVYLVRDWRYLALTTTLPFVCFFLYLWPMPESPRWLLARGQFEKAEVILKNMARINGKSLPANYMVHLRRKYESDKLKQDIEKEKSRKYGILDLFRAPNLRKKTIIITFIWFTNTSVYVGLSYYAPVLGGDEFLNFFLAGVVELPTYLFLWPSMERLGRRWTLCMSMVVGGIACLTTFLVQHETYVTLALYCVGKMGISSSFVVLPLMASELYPTVVRGLGMSLSSVLGMLGPIFIPLVNYLGSDIMVLPLIIMGALLVAGGIASLLLPETLNQHLPQTLEDGEKMGLDTDFCCNPPVKETRHKNEAKDVELDQENCDVCNNLCSCQLVNVPLVENVSAIIEKDSEKVEFILWNLVCNDDFLPTLGLVLLAAGGLIGNYIFGYLQDTIGRKPSFFIYLLIECVFGVATAFAQNYVVWTIYRIGVGFTVPAIMATPYVLAIELVGPRHRTLCTILSNIAYSLGLILLAGVVYLVRDWRYLALTTTLPFVCFFLYLWPMPESPRWLLARGQFEKAEVILKNMARINGKSLPANYMVHLRRKYESDKLKQDIEKEKSRKYGILDLFRAPNLRKKTIIITFIWFTNTSVYVGLSYYAPVLGGDEFLNFFLAGVVELPTYLFLWPSMERLGRRWTLCMSMVVGGIACLTTFLVQHETYVTLALYCVGKMGISSSFVVLPLMASELYPTVVRGLGMSLSSVLGMLGPIFIPLVNYLGSDIMVLPLIIMGALLVAGGIASLLLPETLNQHLPQTLEDGEKMGLDTDFCCNPPVKETRHKNEAKDVELDQENCDVCNNLCSCQLVNVPLVENVSAIIEKDSEKVEFILVK